MWLWLFSCICIIAKALQLEEFVGFQNFQQYHGDDAHSFVMGDYGYFTVAGGYCGSPVQHSRIYKYDNITQKFIKIHNFMYAKGPTSIYPFVVDGKVNLI